MIYSCFHNTICTSFLKAGLFLPKNESYHTADPYIMYFSVMQMFLLSNPVTITTVSVTSHTQSYWAPHMTATG